MAEDELRQVIKDNFKLLSLSFREGGSQIGDIREDLSEVAAQVGSLEEKFSGMADKLDETIEALKPVAFADVEHRQEVAELQERVNALEKWRDEQSRAS